MSLKKFSEVPKGGLFLFPKTNELYIKGIYEEIDVNTYAYVCWKIKDSSVWYLYVNNHEGHKYVLYESTEVEYIEGNLINLINTNFINLEKTNA